MKKVSGQFLGKVKVSLDSKYTHGIGLDEDIAETKRKTEMFEHELETAIDMCYERNVNNFRDYKTAVEILQETLREKFLEYEERL